jgi:TPR repeat protein
MKHIADSSSALVSSVDAPFAFSLSARPQRPRFHAWLDVLSIGLLALLETSSALAGSIGEQDAHTAGAAASTAERSLRAACDGGDAVACNDLGVSYERGYAPAPSAAAAAQLFTRACDGGVADGCNNLGALHERGAGVNLDVSVARQLYGSACQQGSALGCSNLGALHTRGAQRDEGEALRLFSLACATGSATGCQNLEVMVSR